MANEKAQVIVRMDENSKQEFTDFCKKNEMSFNTGMNKAMEILMVDNLKVKVPDQASCIEDFEAHINQILILFRTSIEHSLLADERVRADVKSELKGMSTLAENNEKLQADLEKALSEKIALEAKVTDLTTQLNQAKEGLAKKIEDTTTVISLREQISKLKQANIDLEASYIKQIAELQKENFAMILEVVKASK